MTRIAIELRTTFRSLRARNFRLYLAGLAISATGTWIHIVASAWLVLRLTGSGVALGLEMTFAFAPILLFGAWGGVVADRFDKRRVLLATQSVLAALSATLGALTAAGVVRVWMIYAISFAVGLATAVDHPTRQSFVPEMVGTRAVSNAVSLNSAVFTGTRVVGPAIGAAIIAAVGIAPAFFVDAASYLAVVGSLAVMRAGELHPAERPAGAGGLRAGVRYAWRARELRLPLLLMAVLFSFSFNFVVILPLLARRAFEGGPATYGGLLSVMGAGSFAAALVLARRPSPSVRLLGLAGVGVGVFGVAAALAPSLALEWGALIGLGFAAIAFMITGNTTLQLNAEPAMRGRVMSLYSVVFLGSTPIGAPLAGWIAEHLGPRVALGAGGIIAVAASIVAVRVVRRRPLTQRLVADAEAIPLGERAPEPAEPWPTTAEPWRPPAEPWPTPADAADPESSERTLSA